MILKETILSAFSDRLTLLRWLKKVEAALNNAVLVDISLQQISETEMKLKFVFENGDFVESPVLTIPKGKDGTAATVRIGRVISAEPNVPPDVINTGTDTNAVLDFIIPKGKDGLDGQGIAATVEVGTVTTGAAGTNASVTNVGTEQRAILNFVIPRGDQGEQGEAGDQGAAGVGFDDADELSINDGAINITAGDNGVNIEASFEVAVGEEVLEIPSTMYLPLKGSESIVIDVDESGQFIDVHLDANIVAKLNRVLVTPMTAPQSISLVAVDTANAQTMLTLGSGLSVENGVLSASGGGGGGASVDTSKMFILKQGHLNTVGFILFNAVIDGVFYPVYNVNQYDAFNPSGNIYCGAIIIKGTRDGGVTGDVRTTDGVQVTNLSNVVNKLLIPFENFNIWVEP